MNTHTIKHRLKSLADWFDDGLTVVGSALQRRATAVDMSIALVSIGLLVWLIAAVPPNMDEFLPYRPIACSFYPAASLNTLLEGCNAYPAATVWGWHYFRPYPYVGMLSSAVYYPFFMLWQSVYSHYILGFLFLLAFCMAFMRLHRLDGRWLFALPCFFPITFHIIHDTGPVRFSLVSFVLVAILVRRIEATGRAASAGYAVLAAALIALSIEDKPFFVLLLPGLACYALAFCREAPLTFIKKQAFALVVGVGMVACFVALIAFQRAGPSLERYYYQDLLNTGHIYSKAYFVSRGLAYLISPAGYAHRIFDIPPLTIVASALPFLALFWLPIVVRRSVGGERRIALLVMSLGLLVLAFLQNGAVWAGHHFVFLMVPVLSIFVIRLSVANTLVPRTALAAVAVSCVAILSVTDIQNRSAKGRDVVFKYLSRPDIAERNVINVSDWGVYFIQSLYGAHGQLVTTLMLERPGTSPEPLHALATQAGRGILNVCERCDETSLAKVFPGHAIKEVPLGGRPWRVFEVSAP